MTDSKPSSEKLTPEEKKILADKLLPIFYFCWAIASYMFYLFFRSLLESAPQELILFLESATFEKTLVPISFLSILGFLISGHMYSYKAYGMSPFSGFYVLGDIRLRHLKPLLIVPCYIVLTEIVFYFFF